MGVRVLVIDSVHDLGLSALRSVGDFDVVYRPGLSDEALFAELKTADAVVMRGATRLGADHLAQAPRLRAIGRAGVGVDNIDVAAASKRGVVVMNTPTSHAVAAAEHAFALLLALTRRVVEASSSMRAGRWERSRFSGTELAGKTLGILGFGHIGRLVAERAHAFEMKVVVYDPLLSRDRAEVSGVSLVTFEQLCSVADIISAHTPLTPETRSIVNDATILKMKPGVLLINGARGGIYDEDAMLRGLRSGRVGGVALDVFVEEPPSNPVIRELFSHDRVVMTPHLGASTDESRAREVVEIAQQLAAFFRTGAATHAVNAPSVPQSLVHKIAPFRSAAHRLGSFVAQVRDAFATSDRGAHDRVRFGVACHGDIANIDVAPLVNSALAGFLGHFMEPNVVNDVSAPVLALERGIEVSALSTATATKAGYTSLLRIGVDDGRGPALSAEATLAADGTPRLVTLAGLELDTFLTGEMLLIEAENKPGVIGSIGTLLGRIGVNVARMQASPGVGNGRSITLWSVDVRVNEAGMRSLTDIAEVIRATAVSL